MQIASRLVAGALAVLVALPVAAPAVAGPTGNRLTAAEYAAGWIARQFDDGGAVAGFTGEPDVGATADAALALAAAGVERDAFEQAVAYVATNFEGYVSGGGTDNAGRLGKLALLADAAGLDPTGFGGDAEANDLAARIQATLAAGDDAGRYGAEPNAFAQTTLQSLALLGLVAAGVTPEPSAVTWLVDQQCADGGWPAYRTPEHRSGAGDDCTASVTDGADADDQPDGPYQPDSNGTALAVQALEALDAEPAAVDRALAYLVATQEEDGGWAFEPGFDTDPNSTSLVVQAIAAAGEQPDRGRWLQDDGDHPVAALLSTQVGCEGSGLDEGAFTFLGEVSAFATYQATWGTAGVAFPFGRSPVSGDAPVVPCDVTVERLAGDDRVATSVAVALDAYETAETVVIAQADGYADALAGAPLAASLDAPLLLSAPAGLSDALVPAIEQLGATKAVLLGGEAALSAAVEQQLADRTAIAAADIERVAGDDRFDTAARILARLEAGEVYVTEGIDPDPARGWADSLAVASLAAFEGKGILLVATDELPDATRAALDGVTTATVVGGTSSVTPAVLDEIVGEVGAPVDRIAGDTRYDTAAAVAQAGLAAGLDPTRTFVATGRSFPDALSVGPAVAKAGGILLLVDGQDLTASPAALDVVEQWGWAMRDLLVAGGEAAVAPQVAATLEEAAEAEQP